MAPPPRATEGEAVPTRPGAGEATGRGKGSEGRAADKTSEEEGGEGVRAGSPKKEPEPGRAGKTRPGGATSP